MPRRVSDEGLDFDLIAADIPKAARGRQSQYTDLIKKFKNFEGKSAKIQTDKKPSAIIGGLRHAIQTAEENGEIGKGSMEAVQREGEVFLRKIETKERAA
jgi:hypothetical protein